MAQVHLVRLSADRFHISSVAAPQKFRQGEIKLRGCRLKWQGQKLNQRRRAKCHAALEDDLPIAIAIGACVASSLFLPPGGDGSGADDSKDSSGGADDIRSAAMGIISFIPFFNWLAWVFAWLDTRRTRYLVYSVVYATPYLKNDFSLSPDESWLPLASLVACIVHVQLDTNNASAELTDGSLRDKTLDNAPGGFSLFDKPLSRVKRQLENLPAFSKRGEGKRRSDEREKKPAVEQSEEEIQAAKEIQEWPKTEFKEWDKKLANSQGGSDDEDKDQG